MFAKFSQKTSKSANIRIQMRIKKTAIITKTKSNFSILRKKIKFEELFLNMTEVLVWHSVVFQGTLFELYSVFTQNNTIS